MTLQEFLGAAKRSGISHGEDVSQIKDLILQSSSILEIGAGYGRVLKYIFGLGYSGILDAVENDIDYYQFCVDHYNNKASIYHADIMSWCPDKKYDLVLWMWTGIAEFKPEEQEKLFRKLANMITPSGYIIIEKKDLGSDDSDRVVFEGNRCKFLYDLPGGNLYVPSNDELLKYASNYFEETTIKKYTATGNIERTLLFFRRTSRDPNASSDK